MLWHIILFELKKSLNKPSTFVYGLVFFFWAFIFFLAVGGAFSGATISVGSSIREFANAPYAVHQILLTLHLFQLIVVAALFGQAVTQDYQTHIYQLFFTKPIGKGTYLAGRFLAAFLISIIVACAIPLGAMLAVSSPWVQADVFGPNTWTIYFWPVVTSLAPNILITGSFFFALATLTRRMFPVYTGAVIMVMGYLFAMGLLRNIDNRSLADLIDPFGSLALDSTVRLWPIAKKNITLVPFENLLLVNRIFWVLLGSIAWLITYSRFSFKHVGSSSKNPLPFEDEPALSPRILNSKSIQIKPHFGATFEFRAWWTLTRLQWNETVKNIYFLMIVLAGLIFLLTRSFNTGLFGSETYPVTYLVLDSLGNSFAMFMIIIITFITGDMVWRERDAGMDQVSDILPLPSWVSFSSKLAAILGIVLLMLCLVFASGILVQMVNGYYYFEISQYVRTLFFYRFIDYGLYAVLALTVHCIVNHKFLGHGLVILYHPVLMMMSSLGFQRKIYRLLAPPGFRYSDMNGYDHGAGIYHVYALFWVAFAVLLLGLVHLFWVRSRENDIRNRLALAKSRFSKKTRVFLLITSFLFVGLGAYILYNTDVLNNYQNTAKRDRTAAEYEKKYQPCRDWPQLSLTSLKTEMNIFPKERRIAAHAVYRMDNQTDNQIDKILFSTPLHVKIKHLKSDQGLTLIEQDDTFKLQVFSLNQPLNPGETMSLDFEVELAQHGFPNNDNLTQIVGNGTFFESRLLFPSLGYQEDRELTSNRKRRKYHLPLRGGLPALEDEAARNEPALRGMERIEFEAILSTDDEQTAIAPGQLLREWGEDGRRYFHYKSENEIWNRIPFMSGRYEIRRDHWNDIAIEIYYHKGHEYNLDIMLKGAQDSLAYFTEQFGSLQHKQLRIVEFPRYQGTAPSLPDILAFSESGEFLVRVDGKDPKNTKDPYFATSNALAHQWWTQQLCGARVQGYNLLTESLSQYSALMVLKKRLGNEKMRRLLRTELNRYLQARKAAQSIEPPLVRVENQSYIYIHKASMIFYALQDYLGEEKLNQALADFLKDWAFKDSAFPTSLDLLDYILAATPPELIALVEDMFLHVTFWDMSIQSAQATALPDNSGAGFEVVLTVKTAKNRMESSGNEVEQPLAEWVDIGIFDKENKPLYVARHKIEKREQIIIVRVEERPAQAGIDPFHKLVDRQPEDNSSKIQIN